jgi:hypothetical protein
VNQRSPDSNREEVRLIMATKKPAAKKAAPKKAAAKKKK